MIDNRSVPTNTVLPHVIYQDLLAAIDSLARTFGFVEHYRYGNPPSGAQVRLGNAYIMLKQAKPGVLSPAQLGYETRSLTIFVEDVESHFQRAKSAGARIVEDLHETEYGELQYGAEDLDGHHWLFSRHARDVGPDEWGATVSDATGRLALLPRPRLCYIEIPSVDLGESIAFYENVFGWNIRHRNSEHPSFDDATKDISGAWVLGREISRKPGLLPYIWVDRVDTTLALVRQHGGELLALPHPDSPGGEWIATFRDPAGNVIGLYQEGPR